MNEEIVLNNIEHYIKLLYKDLTKLEQGERPDLSREMVHHLKILEQELELTESDELTAFMSSAYKYVYSPYDSFEIDGHSSIYIFKSSIMSLYFMAHSIIKDLDGVKEQEERIDEIFQSVFPPTQ